MPTNTLSGPRQATWLLASGSVYPSLTNDLVVRSNSRTTLASAPPRESEIRASLYSGLQRLGSMPDPVLLLFLAKGVEIEHDFPVGLGLAVLLERGAPPEPARVLGVAPEVVVKRAELLDGRDAGVGVEDLEDALLERLEPLGSGQLARALGVPFLDPGERLSPSDLFEPLVGIVGLIADGQERSVQRGQQDCPEHEPPNHRSLLRTEFLACEYRQPRQFRPL